MSEERSKWQKALIQFLQERGTAKFTASSLTFNRYTITKGSLPLLEVNFALNVAIYPGWVPVSVEEPAIMSVFRDLSAFRAAPYRKDFADAAPDMVYVPVLFMKPEHEHNLEYLNQSINAALRKLAGHKVRTGQHGANYNCFAATLPAYVKFWGLGDAVHIPSMEERVERLGLQKRFTGYIGRRLKE